MRLGRYVVGFAGTHELARNRRAREVAVVGPALHRVGTLPGSDDNATLARLGLAAERRSHTRLAASLISRVGAVWDADMPIPPLNFVEAREAVQRVREAFGCTEEEAVRFLCDGWIDGALLPRFLGSIPPDDLRYDTGRIDWFSGAIVKTVHLPRRVSRYPGDRPEYSTHTDRYPFKIDRRQLDAILVAAGAAASTSEPAPRSGATVPESAGPLEMGSVAPAEPAGYQPQSEKAKLRGRVRHFLEQEAAADPPRAQTKADWRQLVREEFGDAVSANLFEEAWATAELPAVWRAPGRRT